MNVRRHEIADSLVDKLVTPQPRETCKSLGDDQHAEVPAPVRSARMSCVAMAVVHDFQSLRLERLQSLA